MLEKEGFVEGSLFRIMEFSGQPKEKAPGWGPYLSRVLELSH